MHSLITDYLNVIRIHQRLQLPFAVAEIVVWKLGFDGRRGKGWTFQLN